MAPEEFKPQKPENSRTSSLTMTLDDTTTIDQFREEMQHRVVKYALNSRPVKEALRFAKRHDDPAFYRIAADKIHAQRQFQRELYGPSRMERLVDFIALGSLREVVLTLVLVGGGVVGLDVVKRFMLKEPDSELYANMDVDELATRLGIALEAHDEDGGVKQPAKPAAKREDVKPAKGDDPPPTAQLSDADVARIAEAVIRRLGERKAAETSAAVAPDSDAASRIAAADKNDS